MTAMFFQLRISDSNFYTRYFLPQNIKYKKYIKFYLRELSSKFLNAPCLARSLGRSNMADSLRSLKRACNYSKIACTTTPRRESSARGFAATDALTIESHQATINAKPLSNVTLSLLLLPLASWHATNCATYPGILFKRLNKALWSVHTASSE